MQSSSSANVTLQADSFNNLQNLIALEIHGFRNEMANKSIGMLSLQYDVLKQIHTLEYLNLEHVHLLGQEEQDNKPAPIVASNNMFPTNDFPNSISLIGEDNSDEYQLSGPINHKLKFLSEPSDTKIVAFETYEKGQENASIFTFSGLTRLKILRIFYCNIKHLKWEMFDGLHNLEELSLEGNVLLFLPDFLFYGTPSLKYLCLSHNNLLSVKSTSLIGLLQLEQLDISYNNISHLSELSLPPFPSLKSADFHHNPIERIIPHTFDMMNITKELYIGGYTAALEIQPNSFLGLQSIEKLGMTNIRLMVLEKDHLKGMSKLKELKMQGRIKIIAFDAFIEVNKLEVLVLNNCSIYQISMDTFYGLNDLLYLDLSNNLLEAIPSGAFDHLNSLKELNLQNNKLTKLPLGMFSNLHLHMVRLDQNPWHCTCRMREWNPNVINKIKKPIINNLKCQFRFDKGSMCDLEPVYHYVYEKKITPRCATPYKYKGWSIFHVLRKIYRCEKIKANLEKEVYLFNKLEVIEKFNKTNNQMKYNKFKKIVKTKNSKNIQKIENSKDSNVTSFRTASTKRLEVGDTSEHFEQNIELKDDTINKLSEFNVLSNLLEEKKKILHGIIVENKVTSNKKMMTEITLTSKDNIQSYSMPREVTSQATLMFTELTLPSILKTPLKLQHLKKNVDETSQNNEKLKKKHYTINDKLMRKYDVFDPEMMKANKIKVLQDRFKEKLYKTMQLEKITKGK